MKLLKLVYCFFSLSILTTAQLQYTDLLKNKVYLLMLLDEVKSRKAFMREWWFYEQRAFPDDYIPVNAYKNS